MTNVVLVTALKVLMIGNSFSISNCQHMPQIAQTLGVDLELGSLYIGGCSLERHWRNVVASTNADFKPYQYDLYRQGKRAGKSCKANIPDALRSERWDVVTIQQASPLSWKPESYHPFGDNLIAKIRELAPQAEIVVQETWSYTPWAMKKKLKTLSSPDDMYVRLQRAYATFAESYGLRVIPTGTAIQEWRKRLPVKYTENSFGGDLVGGRHLKAEDRFVQENGAWIPNPGQASDKDGKRKGACDLTHLNERGEYFQSLVWSAKLLKADVRRCAYRPDFVSQQEDVLMKDIANETVFGGALK